MDYQKFVKGKSVGVVPPGHDDQPFKNNPNSGVNKNPMQDAIRRRMKAKTGTDRGGSGKINPGEVTLPYKRHPGQLHGDFKNPDPRSRHM